MVTVEDEEGSSVEGGEWCSVEDEESSVWEGEE